MNDAMNKHQSSVKRGSFTNPAGVAEVTQATRDKLVRLAYRFLWNREDAEDAVQDALTKAHARKDELRDRARWWPWLCRILVNLCHQHVRSKLTFRKHEDTLAKEPQSAEFKQPAELSETADSIRRFLQQLPRRQQEVVVLRHLQQMEYEEIGESLGISPSTARVHARSGLETLRNLMADERPDLLEDR